MMPQGVEQYAVERRQPGSGADEQQRLLVSPWDVKAITRGSEHGYAVAYRRRVMKPAAHPAARNFTDVQFDFGVIGQRSDGVAASQGSFAHDRDVLTGMEGQL